MVNSSERNEVLEAVLENKTELYREVNFVK